MYKRQVLTYPSQQGNARIVNERAVKTVRALYDGNGKGAQLASSNGTAWGPVSYTHLDVYKRQSGTRPPRHPPPGMGSTSPPMPSA